MNQFLCRNVLYRKPNVQGGCKMSVLMVGGIHGVGKSFVIRRAVDIVDPSLPILKGSEILAELLGISTEEIPYVDPDRRASARVQMFLRLQNARVGVRDAHYSVHSSSGYEVVFDVQAARHVVAVVLLVAPEDIVLERRRCTGKDRPLDATQILEHAEIEKEAAKHYSQRLGVPLFIIRNTQSDDAVGELVHLIERYCVESREA